MCELMRYVGPRKHPQIRCDWEANPVVTVIENDGLGNKCGYYAHSSSNILIRVFRRELHMSGRQRLITRHGKIVVKGRSPTKFEHMCALH